MLAVAGNCYLSGAFFPEEKVPFSLSFLWAASAWYTWALLTPLVLWLARRLRLRRGRWGWRAAALALCGVAIVAFKLGCEYAVDLLISGDGWLRILTRAWPWLLSRKLPVNLGVFAAIVGAWYLMTYYRRYRERELEAARLEAQLTVAELRALKAQLHPHFVLNALNTVVAMIHRSPERAEEMLVRIGELLRTALDSREDYLVPLASEVAFLRQYLDIEQIRFDGQLRVELEIAPDLEEALVPSLVLQPFVENAIKHRDVRPGACTRVDIRVWREDGWLRFRVADNGRGLSGDGKGSHHGMGLANTRARLDALYRQSYQLDLSPAGSSGLAVDLRIPFKIRAIAA